MGAYRCHEFHSSGCTRGILARSVQGGNSIFQFVKMVMGIRTWKVADEDGDEAAHVLSLTDGDKA